MGTAQASGLFDASCQAQAVDTTLLRVLYPIFSHWIPSQRKALSRLSPAPRDIPETRPAPVGRPTDCGVFSLRSGSQLGMRCKREHASLGEKHMCKPGLLRAIAVSVYWASVGSHVMSRHIAFAGRR